MANRAEAGAMEAQVAAHGTASHTGPHPSYHGRAVSWVAVGLMVAGFLIGGLSLLFGHHGPTWWLFWVGCGVTVVGLLTSLVTNMFEDWY